MYKEKIIDLGTGEEIWRDYTSEEIAEVEKARLEAEEKAALAKAKENAKKAILEKLGLTSEEIEIFLTK